jgi:hypothetical protein
VGTDQVLCAKGRCDFSVEGSRNAARVVRLLQNITMVVNQEQGRGIPVVAVKEDRDGVRLVYGADMDG